MQIEAKIVKIPLGYMREILLEERIKKLAQLKGRVGRELTKQNPFFLNIVPSNPEEDRILTGMFLNKDQRLRMRRIDFVIRGRTKQALQLGSLF